MCSLKGGFLYVDAVTAATESESSFIASPLPIFLGTLVLSDNNAAVGRDAFIASTSINSQIDESLFDLDLAIFDTTNSMYGNDTELFSGTDIDLLAYLFYSYTAYTIYVGGDHSSDHRACGSTQTPCETLSAGAHHVIPGTDASKLLFVNGSEVGGVMGMTGFTLMPQIEGEVADISLYQEAATFLMLSSHLLLRNTPISHCYMSMKESLSHSQTPPSSTSVPLTLSRSL